MKKSIVGQIWSALSPSAKLKLIVSTIFLVIVGLYYMTGQGESKSTTAWCPTIKGSFGCVFGNNIDLSKVNNNTVTSVSASSPGATIHIETESNRVLLEANQQFSAIGENRGSSIILEPNTVSTFDLEPGTSITLTVQ